MVYNLSLDTSSSVDKDVGKYQSLIDMYLLYTI